MVQDSNEGQHFSDQYEWITTKDGSFTLKSKTEGAEWMHSSQGAYSESQYIYGSALRLALKGFNRSKTLNILSMGLGLGYLEWIALFECAKIGQKVNIESFELDPLLQDLFQSQSELALQVVEPLGYESESLPLDSMGDNGTTNTIDQIKYEIKFNLKIEDFKSGFLNFFIKDYGLDLIYQGLSQLSSIQHYGPFGVEEINKPSEKYNLIFYDAFSSNTQSELWSEDFLNQLLHKKSDPDFCILSTYAKVGTLNRALKNNGFTLQKAKGFAFKRESTLAQRCQVPNPGNIALVKFK
jgi:hypothetical protein